jgi:hypothetical protein
MPQAKAITREQPRPENCKRYRQVQFAELGLAPLNIRDKGAGDARCRGSQALRKSVLFRGPVGSSRPPPIGRRPRNGSGFSTSGYTLCVRDKALAKQHYSRQARNTKLIDPETGIRLKAERRAASC